MQLEFANNTPINSLLIITMGYALLVKGHSDPISQVLRIHSRKQNR